MKIYLVGGAVRDKLLGLPVKEHDWVVVGATSEAMLALGYRQVGKEFPVFLHPQTNEEYALARRERKVKPGYKGFTFDTSTNVTLEDDLKRRDLTINAMAETIDGDIIDPYHGKRDLANKILRHVSPAFAEDPVRILRVGRFLARYAQSGFHVAPETIELMHNMVRAGEVNALVAERVWKELERALSEPNPEKFFIVLAECQALSILFPYLKIQSTGIQALINATKLTPHTTVRFAALLHDSPEPKKTIAELCNRYRSPNEYRELAILTASHYTSALKAKGFSADKLLKLFNTLDFFRRGIRFKHFSLACQAIAFSQQIDFDPHWLLKCAQAAKAYEVKELIAQGLEGQELANKIKEKRIEKIEEWLQRCLLKKRE